MIRSISFLSLLLFISCWNDPSVEDLEKTTFSLQTPNGKIIRTSLAVQDPTRIQGLSGIPSSKFTQDQGMLFVFPKENFRKFWMRDTYFNLDIIFLNKNLVVVAVEKDIPYHPGSKTPPPIYRTAVYYSQYVLETRADSPLGKDIKTGDKFTWKSTPSLEKIKQLMTL